MKASPNLIAALLRTADRIENDLTYDWYDAERCNCGILAQELGVQTSKLMGSWRYMADNEAKDCPITGIPLSEMFKKLYQHGLELGDFAILETPFSMVSGGIRNRQDARQATANYFRQLASELESRLTRTTTAPSVIEVVEWPVTTPVTEEVPV